MREERFLSPTRTNNKRIATYASMVEVVASNLKLTSCSDNCPTKSRTFKITVLATIKKKSDFVFADDLHGQGTQGEAYRV